MSEPIYIDIEVVEPTILRASNPSNVYVASSEISIIKRLTQAEYNALGSYVSTTMYVIVG